MTVLGGLLDLWVPGPLLSPCRNQNPQLEGLAEGCFCPGDQILFSAHTGTCMQDCRKLLHLPRDTTLGPTQAHAGWEGPPRPTTCSPLSPADPCDLFCAPRGTRWPYCGPEPCRVPTVP